MFKDSRYINAGTIEIYRWGKKARAYAAECLEANKNGYISIPVDMGNYWTIGTSEGRYGEYAKYDGTFFTVNKGGYIYAKEGTDKAEKLVNLINGMIAFMDKKNEEREIA